MHDYAERILLALVTELADCALMPEEWLALGHRHAVALRDHGVPYRPSAWFGRPSLTAGQRMACSRAVRQLVFQGLLEAVLDDSRNRIRYLKPTSAGLRRVLELAGDGADRNLIAAGLRKTHWGAALATSVSEAEPDEPIILAWPDTPGQ